MKSQDLLQALLASDNPDDLELAEQMMNSAYMAFQAREDRPDIGDEMTSYLTDDHPGKIVLGGTGSSKSYTTAWLLSHMLITNLPPEQNTPVWVVSTTLDLSGLLWTQILHKFITPDMIEHIRWRKSELEPEIVKLKKASNGNNWNIHFYSCDQKREALQGATIWAAWMDEQAPANIIEEVWGRLRKWGHANKFLLTCTPLNPDPWLQDLWDRRDEPAIRSLYRFYRLNTLCNEHLDQAGVKNWLDSLSPDQRATRQFGDFANFKGACFPEFTSDLIIGPGDVEYENIKGKIDGFEQFIGIDFGFHHPAAAWLARNGDQWYIIDEDQLFDTMPDKLAQRVKRRYDYRHKVYVDYEDIISARTFTAAGIQNSPCAGKKVVHSILLMKDMFWQKKIKVFRNCVQTIRQLRGYRWKDFDENADKAEPDQLKPTVIKVRDHLCDAVKYVIWTAAKRTTKPWPQLPSRSIRSIGGGAMGGSVGGGMARGAAGIPHILRPNPGRYDFRNRR